MKKVKLYLSLLILSMTLIAPLTVKAALSPTTGMVIISETEEGTKQEKAETKNVRKSTKKHSLYKKKKLQKLRKIKIAKPKIKGGLNGKNN